MTGFRSTFFSISLTLLALTGCIPFTVGSTALPVLPGESSQSMAVFVVPNSFRIDDTLSVSRMGADMEWRTGFDDRSDIGLRIPSYSGAIVNYKRRLDGATVKPGPAIAAMAGAGFVNFGSHAHFELTLLASGAESNFVPYGGFRAMQVFPISRGAVKDRPTLGGFGGVKIVNDRVSLSPELGVFYDHSALKLRRGNLIIVPAVTITMSGSEWRGRGLW